MTVISNTSPITNLHAIGELNLLRRLYGQVVIPPAVKAELQEGVLRGDHPALDTEWEWLVVKPPTRNELLETLLNRLDAGEAEAIALAKELSAYLLLMDELAGRKAAAQLGIRVVGVLGVLLDAKAMGYISLIHPLLERLRRETGFWIGADLHAEVLRLAGEE